MKYKEYTSKKELGLYIISELNRTIKLLSNSNDVQSELAMFRSPKAKKADLIAKKQEVMEKCGLTKKDLK